MSTTSSRWIHRGVSALLGLVLFAAPVMSPAQAEPINDGPDRAATEQPDLPVVWNNSTLRLARKRVEEGKRVQVRVDLGGRRTIKKQTIYSQEVCHNNA